MHTAAIDDNIFSREMPTADSMDELAGQATGKRGGIRFLVSGRILEYGEGFGVAPVLLMG